GACHRGGRPVPHPVQAWQGHLRERGAARMTPEHRPRVLLADDHLMVAEGIAGLVAEKCELLEIVSDGHALFERAVEHAPDLIITDVSMPGCSGITAVRNLNSAGYRIPVIFMTVHTEPAMVR